MLSVGLGFCFPLLSVIERELSLTALSGASGRCPRSHRRTHSAVMDLRAPVLRALEAAGVSTPPEPLVALLRGHMSSAAISQTIASHTKARVQERAADAERFAALHEELRSRGVKDLDRLTMFLQRVSDEKAVMQMLRSESEARANGSDFAV